MRGRGNRYEVEVGGEGRSGQMGARAWESKDKGSGTARARRDKEAGDDGRALAAGPLSDRVTD